MITRLAKSSLAQDLPRYRSMLAGNDAYIPTAFESISSTTISTSGTTSSVTFSSIPSTYQHLQIRGMAENNNGDTLRLRFNNDSGTNYTEHYIHTNGSTISPGGNASGSITGTFIASLPGSTDNYSMFIIDIHNYASTTANKTVRSFAGRDRNAAGNVYINSGLWLSTSAITSVRLYIPTFFDSGSVFSLYGIKGE